MQQKYISVLNFCITVLNFVNFLKYTCCKCFKIYSCTVHFVNVLKYAVVHFVNALKDTVVHVVNVVKFIDTIIQIVTVEQGRIVHKY